MAAVAYDLPNAPADVKVFYQSEPASSVLQRKIFASSAKSNYVSVFRSEK